MSQNDFEYICPYYYFEPESYEWISEDSKWAKIKKHLKIFLAIGTLNVPLIKELLTECDMSIKIKTLICNDKIEVNCLEYLASNRCPNYYENNHYLLIVCIFYYYIVG